MLSGHLQGLACCACLYSYTIQQLHAASIIKPTDRTRQLFNLSLLCRGARPRSSRIQHSGPCQLQMSQLHQGVLCPCRGPGNGCIVALAGRDKKESAPEMCPPIIHKLIPHTPHKATSPAMVLFRIQCCQAIHQKNYLKVPQRLLKIDTDLEFSQK